MGRGFVAAVLAVVAVLGGCGGGGDAERSPSGGSSGAASDGSTAHPAGRWQDIEVHGIALRVPAGWTRLDIDDCAFAFTRLGPPDADPCDADAVGVALYPSATFDPATRPGTLTRGDGRVAGYVSAGDRYAVHASTASRTVSEQVLASARPDDARLGPGAGRWVSQREDGLTWRYPAWWDKADIDPRLALARPTLGVVEGVSLEPRQRGGRWLGTSILISGPSLLVHATTEAVAQLILGSFRPVR